MKGEMKNENGMRLIFFSLAFFFDVIPNISPLNMNAN